MNDSSTIIFVFLLRSSFFENFRPFVWVEKFRIKLWGEIWVGERGWVVGLHERNRVLVMLPFPELPEPFGVRPRWGSETGYGEYSPMQEDSELSFIEPGWERSGIDGFPGWIVLRFGSQHEQQPRQELKFLARRHHHHHHHYHAVLCVMTYDVSTRRAIIGSGVPIEPNESGSGKHRLSISDSGSVDISLEFLKKKVKY